MKNTIFLLSITALSFSYGCKDAKKETKEMNSEVEATIMDVESEKESKSITITLEPKSESDVKGEVTFTQDGETVAMMATLSGLSEGEHAIHIHETADCSSADGKSAGGHWNPTFQPHGKWGTEEGYHKGDIGNFAADVDGNATVEFSTDEWCIDCDDETKNILEKGVIVHQGTDDYTSQPSGDAGARVSCAGIIQ
ncbi:superoxide dismutase family protein [Cellulophaga sp. HaHaR_3_176]|uniref:superoxide dismutase family protein n=1 Tax=Cellulophaga sp. HaHaR_3_176 TaxID=1942464 RepID=UPI001C2003FD|nr:superoxide dismutase family protein [Cellulophaga sp. HaHaR_3_176]QWX85543.1 superoxide dismutase family protein [Cellulophaga sp. HaHaR_3_176]